MQREPLLLCEETLNVERFPPDKMGRKLVRSPASLVESLRRRWLWPAIALCALALFAAGLVVGSARRLVAGPAR